jgi:pimeloyl-ACP methyl ester carboxylesterase
VTTQHTIQTMAGAVPVTLLDQGEGRPILLLHGGAGLDSVAGYAATLASAGPARVITPLMPGFGGTQRPTQLQSVRDVAGLYAALLDDLGLDDVTVVGNSLGGWVAVELALAAPGRLGGLVVIDAVGLASQAHPVAGFFSLTMDQVVEISWAHPEAHRIDPRAMTEEQQRIAAGNRSALLVYGTADMADPELRARLAGITAPTLVIWGEADGMATPDYGREYAAAIPGARFELVPDAGHLPQLEAPTVLTPLLLDFVRAHASAASES